MDPVDEEIGEADEQRKLEIIVPHARAVFGSVIELRVAANFGKEEGYSEDSHAGKCPCGLVDLHDDLIFEELGVVYGSLVEDKDIRERGGCEIEDEAKDPTRQ